MAQEVHIDIGPTTPVDVTANLAVGDYIAQVRHGVPVDGLGVLYGTATTAPISDDDYFECRATLYFTFKVGSGIAPTWVKSQNGNMVVAVASYG